MTPADPQPGPGLIRRTLSRRWLPILALWLVATAGLIAANHWLTRPSYRSAALLRVTPLEPDLFVGREPRADLPELETQVQLITSPNVLTAAGTAAKVAKLGRIQGSNDPVSDLRKWLSVQVIPQTRLIEVAMTSDSPTDSATLVNAVVDAYLTAIDEWAEGMNRIQIKKLDSYLNELRTRLEDIERHWRELVARGETDPEATLKAGPKNAMDNQIHREQYRQLQAMLFEVKIELAQAEAWSKAKQADAMNPEKVPGSPTDEARLVREVQRRSSIDPEVSEMMNLIADAEKRVEKARRIAANEGDPGVRMAQEKLKFLKEALESLNQTKSRIIREEILAEKDIWREIRDADVRVRSLRIKQETLKQVAASFEVVQQAPPANEVDLVLLKEQRASLREMETAVARRLEQIKFEARGEARIRIVSPALPAGRPLSKSYSMIQGLIPLAILAASFLFFTGVEAISGPLRKARPVSEV